MNTPWHILDDLQAEEVTVPAGETLFSEGEMPRYAWMLADGEIILSKDAQPIENVRAASAHQPLDEWAVMGNVAHTMRAIARVESRLQRYRVEALYAHPEFSEVARKCLATLLIRENARREALESSVSYQPYSAQLIPGPFEFPNSEIVFIFCDAALREVPLPQGMQLLGSRILIAAAHFPQSHSVHTPQHRFDYRETTFFLPVRVGSHVGLYVPYIFTDLYEPILLGREFYGFPKQIGQTVIHKADHAACNLHDDSIFKVGFASEQRADEAQLVGAFGTLFGVPNGVTSSAFRVGDTLLSAMGIPFYRRVSVFNHKRVPAADATLEKPSLAADRITRALFTVDRWQDIRRLDIDLALAHWVGAGTRIQHVRFREAFWTNLDMRLSVGQVLRDFNAE